MLKINRRQAPRWKGWLLCTGTLVISHAVWASMATNPEAGSAPTAPLSVGSAAATTVGAAPSAELSRDSTFTGQENASPTGVDDHIVAIISYSEEKNLSDPCKAVRSVERLQLFADGRLFRVTNHQRTGCFPAKGKNRDEIEIRQQGKVGSPQESRIASGQLNGLLDSLKRHHKELQVPRENQGFGVDARRTSFDSRLLSISLSSEPSGVMTALDLEKVTSDSEVSVKIWESMKKEIQFAEIH